MYQEGALYLTFSGVPSSVSRLSSPGEKEGKKAQGRKRKNETQASNCQISDNAKFHHCYPGYSGNHFTRLRRHLGLKSEIFIKPLTSRFAKAVALCLNFSCVKMVSGTQTCCPQAPHPVMDQQWHSQTSSKAPFPGDQGGPGPSPLPTVPLGCSSSSHWCCSHQHMATAPANTTFLGDRAPSHTLALRSRIVHGSVFSPVQPGIPSS